MEELTDDQETFLICLEQTCRVNHRDVFVGTWEAIRMMRGNKDLLNQLEQRGYIAPYMQIGDYWTVKPTRSEGLERDAIQANYE